LKNTTFNLERKKNQMDRWPNFFIVGTQKAGTTTLYEYLNEISDVYMSPTKEPRYFNSEILFSHISQIKEKSEYLNLFRNVKDQKAIGEASPGYLRDPMSAKLIHDAVPKAKIIILLRDPIERAFSAYLMHKSKGVTKKSFHEIISEGNKRKPGNSVEFRGYLLNGLYYKQVKKYYDVFGPNRVKVWIFEEFVKNLELTVREVLDFLEIDSNIPKNIGKAYNEYGVPRGKISEKILRNKTVVRMANKLVPQSFGFKIRKNILLKAEKKPTILEDDRKALESFFREDVKKLEKLLQRKLPWRWEDNGD